jgi:magnesium chelatase family protein
MSRLKSRELSNTPIGRTIKPKDIVRDVFAIQQDRFKTYPNIIFNADIPAGLIKKFCVLDSGAEDLLNKAVRALGLSTRAYFKTLRVARTIADFSASTNILSAHISEALLFRPKSSLEM